jgi:Kef-type K+ transport system membrane component KefB
VNLSCLFCRFILFMLLCDLVISIFLSCLFMRFRVSRVGHIPNFSETLFTPESMSNLQLFSQFGLILYLFTMGLEVLIPPNFILMYSLFISWSTYSCLSINS